MGPKMCINPSFVWVERGPKWEQQPVACRQCWRCKQNKFHDLVGRALCEAATSTAVCVLTLTYAPRDDLADKVLLPAHFQLFMKRLRRAGHKVRYLVAGEYGALRGRAHFHAILFFTKLQPVAGDVPTYNRAHILDPETSGRFSREIPHKQMVHICEWPHGHVTADWAGDEASIRYVCKYILAEDKRNAWLSWSKKPTLGHEWFQRKAETARQLSVLPSSFEYLPPGADRKRPYMMTGATRRDYLNAITTDAADRPRMSEWVGKTFDKYERQRLLESMEGQPLDEVIASMLDRRALDDERDAVAQSRSYWDHNAELDEAMKRSPSKTLRRHDGRWLPTEEIENGPTQN